MQQDEWVVCRVFKKTEAAKKYISNSSSSTSHHHQSQTRASILSANNNHPSYSSDLLQFPSHLQPHTSLNINQTLMANAVHLAELSRVFRGSTSSTMDSAHQQLMSYNHMPVSGLNLNLGGALVQPPPPTVSLEDVVAVSASFNGENGFGNVEMSQCMDLDGYWPSYWLEVVTFEICFCFLSLVWRRKFRLQVGNTFCFCFCYCICLAVQGKI